MKTKQNKNLPAYVIVSGGGPSLGRWLGQGADALWRGWVPLEDAEKGGGLSFWLVRGAEETAVHEVEPGRGPLLGTQTADALILCV